MRIVEISLSIILLVILAKLMGILNSLKGVNAILLTTFLLFQPLFAINPVRLRAETLPASFPTEIPSEEESPIEEDPIEYLFDMTLPLDDSFHTLPIEIVGAASNSNGVTKVNLYWENESGTVGLITTLHNFDNLDVFDWHYLWTPPAFGLYTVRAELVDGSDNSVAYDFAYRVEYGMPEVIDNAPTFNFTMPISGTNYIGVIPISFESSDDIDLDRIEIFIRESGDANPWFELVEIDLSTDVETAFSDLIEITLLTEGIYDFYGVAYDSSDQPSEDALVLNVAYSFETEEEDTIPPVLITKDVVLNEGSSIPSFSDFVLSNPENLPVSCTAIAAEEMFVGQPQLTKEKLISCSVSDSAGNTTESTSKLIVNNVLPSVVVIADPSVNVNQGTTVSLIGNILSGSPSFTYQWYGNCIGSGSVTGFGLTGSTTVSPIAGSYLCGIRVTDSDGDVGAAGVLVNVANVSGVGNAPVDNNTPDQNNNQNNNQNPEDGTSPDVEGINTDNTVSPPVDGLPTDSNTNGAITNQVSGASPLVIICLVAGAILIIGLLLFLFFRGNDEEEESNKKNKK